MKPISLIALLLLLVGCGKPTTQPSKGTQSSLITIDNLFPANALCKTQLDAAHVVVDFSDTDIEHPKLKKPAINSGDQTSVEIATQLAILRQRALIPHQFASVIIVPDSQPIENGTNIFLLAAHRLGENLRQSGATQVLYQCFTHFGGWIQYTNACHLPLFQTDEIAEPTAAASPSVGPQKVDGQ